VKSETQLIKTYIAEAEGTAATNAREANRAHARLHRVYKELIASAHGKTAISSLVTHENPKVRLWSAAHSLAWNEPAARATLEQLKHFDDLLGFEAEMTLREFDAGRLSFEF
jgi:hypothetical protein